MSETYILIVSKDGEQTQVNHVESITADAPEIPDQPIPDAFEAMLDNALADVADPDLVNDMFNVGDLFDDALPPDE